VTVDSSDLLSERNESNNDWGMALPQALICR
jgi:hypothetical protein